MHKLAASRPAFRRPFPHLSAAVGGRRYGTRPSHSSSSPSLAGGRL
jgi:hypothetical protein